MFENVREFLLTLAEKAINLIDRLTSMDFRDDIHDEGLKKF